MSPRTKELRRTCVLLGGNGRAVAPSLQPPRVAALLLSACAPCPRKTQACESLRTDR